MYWLGLAIQIVVSSLLTSILVLLSRRHLVRAFPWLTIYLAFGLLRTVVGSITLSRPTVYFYVFWITAPLETALTILAAHESFRRVFRVFYLLWWFRTLLPTGIIFALLYSALHYYFSPPINASPLAASVISAMLAAQYVILTMALGFFALAGLLGVPSTVHEYRFLLGFAISSLSIALAASVRSEFGTKFPFLSDMLPSVAYLLVLVIWLAAARHPLPPPTRCWDDQVSPQALAQVLRRQLLGIRAILGRR